MTTSNRSSGGFRGYSNEQKTLRAKLDHLLKWTRDLKSNLMKQSCKILQNNTKDNVNCELIDQIHEDLDEYKRKFDRELGRIHDICDALTNNPTNNDTENIRDEILEALRRSPTYSSLEQHIYNDNGPRIRVKPREKLHPGQKQKTRTPYLSTDTIKRKSSQPIALQVIDTSTVLGAKRRPQIQSFKRSRSFTNVEHTEAQLGMDYIEEDENDLSWKPFGPKRSTPKTSEQPLTSSIKTSQSLPVMPVEKSQANDDQSSDEEFDVAWQRRAKQKGQKETTASTPSAFQSPAKRTVRFSPSTRDPLDLIEIDLDETTQDTFSQRKDQNNNQNKQQTELVQIDNDDEETTTTEISSQINRTTSSSIQIGDADSQIIVDSDDDEIIALSDDDDSPPKKSTISKRKSLWTTSEIQISTGNSQSQSLHNPYRVGITDPSIRSVFLPPPNSQSMSGSTNGNRRSQNSNRKTSPSKRSTHAK